MESLTGTSATVSQMNLPTSRLTADLIVNGGRGRFRPKPRHRRRRPPTLKAAAHFALVALCRMATSGPYRPFQEWLPKDSLLKDLILAPALRKHLANDTLSPSAWFQNAVKGDHHGIAKPRCSFLKAMLVGLYPIAIRVLKIDLPQPVAAPRVYGVGLAARVTPRHTHHC